MTSFGLCAACKRMNANCSTTRWLVIEEKILIIHEKKKKSRPTANYSAHLLVKLVRSNIDKPLTRPNIMSKSGLQHKN